MPSENRVPNEVGIGLPQLQGRPGARPQIAGLGTVSGHDDFDARLVDMAGSPPFHYRFRKTGTASVR